MELGTFSTDTFSKLKPAKSPGPDNIHPMFLIETAYNIALPLTLIFRKSLDEGVLPEEWNYGSVPTSLRYIKKDSDQKLKTIDPSL